ncbi:MAG: cytochrome d ubiquinol oxidase subunit II [Acetobacteraceae bacterium]
MSNYVLDLIPLWTAFLAFTVFYYVLFDGFDLGVGMLYGLAPEAAWQPLIMNSVAPIWDGNETWLVLGGLGLLAAFPLAYAIIIPAVYFPILAMLLGLVFRGVAFEFRFKHAAARRFWDRGFCVGSAVATFAQGVILGTFVQGFDVKGRVFAGTSFDWLTPFAILCGIALMLGYTLLGAGWLIMKTEGGLQAWARSAGRAALVGTALAILAVSIWTPLRVQAIAERWFSWPNIGFLSPVPVLAILVVIGEWRSLNRGPEFLPFFGGIALFLLSYIGIAISLWPMIVPFHYTIWQAASSTSTQVFLMIGTMFLLPVILGYTAWSYWVFRGKVKGNIGYH